MRFRLATLGLVAFWAGGASAGPALSMRTQGPQTVHDVDNLRVNVTVENTGDVTLTLLNDPRVLSPFMTHTFSIFSDAGDSPSFTGALVKYSPNEAIRLNSSDEYTVLAPGEKVTVQHDLAGTYNFTTSGEGAYTFGASNLFYYVDPETNVAREIEASVTHFANFRVLGTLASVKNLPTITGSLEKRATFASSCSAAQRTQINTALRTTASYITNSRSHLRTLTSASSRYSTWFGIWSTSRKDTVLNHFTRMNAFPPTGYRYMCGGRQCTDSTYAYVYPNSFGYVYLCPAFWRAPNAGENSRAGTIVHEASHFTYNGGTNDIVYGVTRAKALARSSPAQAIRNADNHEYFAENLP